MKEATMKKTLTVLAGLLLIGGCQTFEQSKKERNTSVADELATLSTASTAPVPISEEAALDTLIPQPSTQPKIIEPRFDVSVKNADIRHFLLGLVDSTPYNLIVADDVKGKISLQLKNVTVSEVLNALERMYPLLVEKQGNLLMVSNAETMTAIYPVDYLNLKRRGKSHTSVAGQAIQKGGSGGANKQQNKNNNSSSSSGSQVQLLNSSEIETTSEADFWKGLQQSLSLIIANEEKASVVVSPQAGIVVVRALPKTQRLIKEYLGITQSGLNRQVILEAKILEVTLNDGFQSGIDWSKLNTVNGGDLVTFGQQGQVFPSEESDAPLNGVFSLLYQGNNFEAAIDLLKSQGDVQVLSSPRVSTVNNQKAVIKVGSDEFFVTDVSTTTVTGTSTATTPDVTLTPFFSGISLDVTPQINDKNEIILHIHPVVSEVQDQQKTITLGSDLFTLPLALTNVRESDSIVRTKADQIIVIGGLMQNKVKTTENSTPLLGDIPVVGHLFKQTREQLVKSELVILLRANVVDGEFSRQQIKDIESRLRGY